MGGVLEDSWRGSGRQVEGAWRHVVEFWEERWRGWRTGGGSLTGIGSAKGERKKVAVFWISVVQNGLKRRENEGEREKTGCFYLLPGRNVRMTEKRSFTSFRMTGEKIQDDNGRGTGGQVEGSGGQVEGAWRHVVEFRETRGRVPGGEPKGKGVTGR